MPSRFASGLPQLTPETLGVTMGFAAIGIGLFILFAMAFVGGLGSAFYTYSACGSAVTVILAGLASRKAAKREVAFWLLAVAGLVYLPVIYHRFAWGWGIDWGGVIFDLLYVAFLLSFLYAQRHAAIRDPHVGDA